MATNSERISNNYRYVAEEYYSPEHETCRNFEDATELFFREKLGGLAVPQGGVTLDAGSGSGLSERYLGAAHSDKLVEMDMQAGMLKQSDGMRVQGNALTLPFADGSFDKVTGFLFDPFNYTPLENEVLRTLKPGGVFLGTLPSWDWASSLRYIEGINPDQTRFRLTGTNIHIFVPSYASRPDDITNRFRAAGFTDVQLLPIFPDPTKPVSKHIHSVAELLGKTPGELEIVTFIKATKS